MFPIIRQVMLLYFIFITVLPIWFRVLKVLKYITGIKGLNMKSNWIGIVNNKLNIELLSTKCRYLDNSNSKLKYNMYCIISLFTYWHFKITSALSFKSRSVVFFFHLSVDLKEKYLTKITKIVSQVWKTCHLFIPLNEYIYTFISTWLW